MNQLIEKNYKLIKLFFNKNDLKIIIISFFIQFFIHLKLINNNIIYLDGLWNYGSFFSLKWEFSIGRLFLPLIYLLKGTFNSSFFSSIISFILNSICIVLIIKLFNIENKIIKFIIILLFSSTPALSMTLMYPFTSDAYIFSKLLSILSIYFLIKLNSKLKYFLSGICIFLSLNLYQIYFNYSLTLLFIIFIFFFIKNKMNIKTFIKYNIILVIYLIIYYIFLIIVLKILNISFSDYRGANNFIKFNEIFYSILNSYHFFMSFYFKNDILNNTFIYKRHFFNLIIIIFIIINFILIIKKNFKNNSNKFYKKYLILSLFFIFPIVINFVSVITNQKTIYLLMTESYFLLYLILIVQLDSFKFNKLKFIKIISYIIIFILIGSFVIADNATYEAQTIFNNKLNSLGNQLAFEINNREEYEGKNILIIGDMEFKIQNNRLLNLINFDFYKNYSAYSYASFFKNNNYFINDFYSDDNLVEEIKNKNEFKNMKEYSIKIINNIIIIKLKNT